MLEDDFLGLLNGEDRRTMVEALGLLQNVDTVVMKGSMLRMGVCVAALCEKAKKLENLDLQKW